MSLSVKPFDIVVFGASGYTGRLVAEYLAAEYAGSDLKWAMAGRSLEKLAAVRAEMGISEAVELLAVDVDNPDSVTQMVDACQVVITTVGPYQLYGDELVKQCAERGTDYVDRRESRAGCTRRSRSTAARPKHRARASFTAAASTPFRLTWVCIGYNNTRSQKRASRSSRSKAGSVP